VLTTASSGTHRRARREALSLRVRTRSVLDTRHGVLEALVSSSRQTLDVCVTVADRGIRPFAIVFGALPVLLGPGGVGQTRVPSLNNPGTGGSTKTALGAVTSRTSKGQRGCDTIV
jgi:hypothetical protein